MPLSIKIPDCAGAVHEIQVSTTGSGDSFDITLVNHGDPERDDMLVFMGVPRCECYRIEEILDLGLQEVFEDPEFADVFLRAIKDQGIEALGMDGEIFARYVVNFVQWLINEEGTCAGPFMESVHENTQFVEHSDIFKSTVTALAREAYDCSDFSLFKTLSKMTSQQLITIQAEDIEDRDTGTSAGHVYSKTQVDFLFGGQSMESWTFAWKGWFSGYFPFRWQTEIEQIDEPDWYNLVDYLRVVGIDYNEIEAEHKPEEPELPNIYWSKGDWAVLLDGFVAARFKTEEDAYAVYDAMRDASSFRGYTDGSNAEVVHKASDPDRAGNEDYTYDPEDPTTWETIVSDEV